MTLKRMFDLICATIGLVFFSPLMAMIAILVRCTSPGSVVFRQLRIGHHGKEFELLKFRSMKDGSGDPGEHLSRDDHRITPIGKILRRTHLDELPQLWNVARGDMSLVGPRPLTPEWIGRWGRNSPRIVTRSQCMPGLTGLAQIKVHRNHSDAASYLRKNLLFDVVYCRRKCFWLDLTILAKTPLVILRRQGV